MANKYTQYGAVVAGAAVIPAIASGISAASAAAKTLAPVYEGGALIQAGQAGGVDAAAAAGSQAFGSTLSSTLNNPAFMTSVGLGLAGLVLGSGSKMPSLNLPNIAATAAVALSVSSMLKQGKAAAAAMEQQAKSRGGALTTPSTFKTAAASDPNVKVVNEREKGRTLQLSFPKTLNSDYWMKFSVRKYNRRAAESNGSSTLSDFHTTIKLPLPTSLIDALKLSYQELGMGVFGGPMLDIASNAYDSYNAASGSAGDKLRAAKTTGMGGMSSLLETDGVKSALLRKMMTNSTLGAAFDMITGNAPNPHMTVSFNGVNLKKHQFTWRLSPDNYAESRELENIIRQLQAAALPRTEGEFGLLLTFPDIVVVEMNPSNLIPFKPCAIDSVGINYAPNGVPSFFRAKDPKVDDGKRYPTEVELTIVLREMDIHTSNMPFYDEARKGQIEYYENATPTSATQTSEATQARNTTVMSA